MAGLSKVRFDAHLLPAVEHFDCGDSVCGLNAAKWLKGNPSVTEDCALTVIEKFGTEVWLYKTAEGELVGFASLGHTRWRIPNSDSPRKLVSVIPWLGIQPKFRKKPEGAPIEETYAGLILDDLISEAESHEDRDRFICLCVHRANTGAIRLYKHFGFWTMKDRYIDRDTGVSFDRMVLELHRDAESVAPPSDLVGK